MKQSIKHALRPHTEKALSDQQFAQLNDIQRAAVRPAKIRSWRPALAASLVLALAVITGWYLVQDQELATVEKIAAEVVENHLHLKPLEVSGAELADIRGYFDRLAFNPVNSDYLASRNLNLLGGRYCAVQGITAAQLRLKRVGMTELHTLYQVPYDPAVFDKLPNHDLGEQPVAVYNRGIKVTLWIEKGILLALTEEAK
ncbi:MAG: hypothetical protein ACWA5Q_08470 [bacterium]